MEVVERRLFLLVLLLLVLLLVLLPAADARTPHTPRLPLSQPFTHWSRHLGHISLLRFPPFRPHHTLNMYNFSPMELRGLCPASGNNRVNSRVGDAGLAPTPAAASRLPNDILVTGVMTVISEPEVRVARPR